MEVKYIGIWTFDFQIPIGKLDAGEIGKGALSRYGKIHPMTRDRPGTECLKRMALEWGRKKRLRVGSATRALSQNEL